MGERGTAQIPVGPREQAGREGCSVGRHVTAEAIDLLRRHPGVRDLQPTPLTPSLLEVCLTSFLRIPGCFLFP